MMQEKQVFLKPVYMKQPKSYWQAMKFIEKSIDEGNPVSLLILSHQAKELEDDNWHWVCNIVVMENGLCFLIVVYVVK